jgi:SAM-dependent methyltransferase
MIMKEIDAIIRYYADIVPQYERLAGYQDPEAEKLREEMKTRWQASLQGKRVLEIACGTGYWTETIAEVAEELVATDINENMLVVARERLKKHANITFVKADAYTLENVEGMYSGAFAHWWWSHIPKKKVRPFLETLRTKLEDGSPVLFSDHLPDYCDVNFRISYNDDGDRIEERIMKKSGHKHYVIKNFLTEEEALEYLSGIATDMQYTAYKNHWELFYRVKR